MAQQSNHVKAASVLMAFAAIALGPTKVNASDTLREIHERYGRSSIAAPFRSEPSRPQPQQNTNPYADAMPIKAHDHAVSSFAGLGIVVNGVQLDQRIDEAILATYETARLKRNHWRDSQRKPVRRQFTTQYINQGNVLTVRDEMSVTPSPWHSGSLIIGLSRQHRVSHKLPDQMITEADYLDAIKATYGEPPVDEAGRQRMFPSPPRPYTGHSYGGREMIYPVKDGAIQDVECWHPSRVMKSDTNETSIKPEGYLEEIERGWCDAVMVHYYYMDDSNPGRIKAYGTVVRDFRLQAHAMIMDSKLAAEATEERQAATPSAAPRL